MISRIHRARDAIIGTAHDVDRRWRDLPLRTRLTTAAAATATLTIIAVVAVAYVAVRHELRGQIDSQLRHQTHEIVVGTGFNPQTGYGYNVNNGVGDTGSYSQIIAESGAAVPGGDPLPISPEDVAVAAGQRSVALHDATYGGHQIRLITVPLNRAGLAAQIALPLRDVNRQLRVLALAFLVLALGGFLLTVLASWGAVRRIMRPIDSFTTTAEEIAETRDLTLRIQSYGSDELGRLAGSFNTMLDALERSLDAQRQLVVDASHELRTPLASLRTNVEVLNDIDRLSPPQREALLAGIVSQLEELTGLVADVVELARGESPPSEHEEIAWDEVVETAVARARRHWPSLTFACRTEPVRVRGVTGRLERAVANMLDNAGKFSPAGSVVDVDLRANGVLTVADVGPGVPPEVLPYVFDRFYRADDARALPGSGLGLAIVKQVVDGLGGTIELANRPGGGAVATMTLPILMPVYAPPAEESLFR